MKSKILIEKEKNTNTGITLIALVITKETYIKTDFKVIILKIDSYRIKDKTSPKSGVFLRYKRIKKKK